MVRVLHSSDLHGRYRRLLTGLREWEYDVWVDTGDFFPDLTGLSTDQEREYQRGFFAYHSHEFITALAGRPVVTMPGNHDRVDLGTLLRAADCPNVHRPNRNGVIEVCGLTWAGFRNVTPISGRWEAETQPYDLVDLVESFAKLDPQPDVLVTHSPPAGILDQGYSGVGYGIQPLYQHFNRTNFERRAANLSNTRYHLFGHIHEQGGRDLHELGVRFYNGATCVRLLDGDHELV